MPRMLQVPIEDVLSIVSCAEDYGYGDDVLMSAMADFCEHIVEDSDLIEYAEGVGCMEGYGPEDTEEILRRLRRS